MKIVITLLVGIVLGAAAVWFYHTSQGQSTVRAAGEQIENGARSARDGLQEKLRAAGHAIADATADARITTAIKGKLLANRELSALSISVNTTGGVVTLSGPVTSAEEVSKAILLAMETDGVREVISTLQIKAKDGKTR